VCTSVVINFLHVHLFHVLSYSLRVSFVEAIVMVVKHLVLLLIDFELPRLVIVVKCKWFR